MKGYTRPTRFKAFPAIHLSLLKRQAIFQYLSEHPFNKPVIQGRFHNVLMNFMLDSGSDISVVAESLVRKLIPTLKLRLLAFPIICFPFDKDPGDCNKNKVAPPLPIEYFALVNIELLSLRFRFPIYCHPGPVPIMLIGNDLLSKLNCNINVALSRITFPLPKDCKAGDAFNNWVEGVSRHMDEEGLKIAQSIGQIVTRNGCISADNPDCSPNKNKDLGVSRLLQGIDLNSNESLVYPTCSYNLEPFSAVEMLCRSDKLKLRTNDFYQVFIINRDPSQRVSSEGGFKCIFKHLTEDSDLFHIKLESSSGYQLKANHACAVIKKFNVYHVAEVAFKAESHDKINSSINQSPSYPEKSSFKPTPFFDRVTSSK